MFDIVVQNLPTIIVGSVVAAVLAGIAAKLIRDKRAGKSSCGGGCAGCPSAGSCHTK